MHLIGPTSINANCEPADAVVFKGTRPLAAEYSLVLEASAIDHELAQIDGDWVLTVAPGRSSRALEEIATYQAERSVPRAFVRSDTPIAGAFYGAAGYLLILLLTAHCAGIGAFGVDWFSAGALEAGNVRQGWRAVTALTLHASQTHLLSNLLAGSIAGVAASRLLDAGVAWMLIVTSATLGNVAEILIAPAGHRVIGASSAVFAALGLLTGLAWRQRLTLRERRWYRWAPLIAGVCLLTFLGAGTDHVDVLGHALGFSVRYARRLAMRPNPDAVRDIAVAQRAHPGRRRRGDGRVHRRRVAGRSSVCLKRARMKKPD